jgi:hypothetical protein
LSIGAGVGDDDKAGFLEGASNVVSEITRGETTSDGDGTGVCGKFQDSALTIGTSRDNTDVGWVVNSGDNSGGQDNLLPVEEKMIRVAFFETLNDALDPNIPSLSNVNNIDSIRSSLPEVRLHVNLQVLGSKVALSREKMLNVLGGRIENRGEI